MSVRQGILVLLAEQAMHVSQLKAEFESRTGGAWPVNIGQVFTTLQRLERDTLVERAPHEGTTELERFSLTDLGRDEVAAWWSRPVERGAPARDELAIKLALAVTSHGIDVRAVVQAQRTETMRALHDYTRLKAAGRPDTTPRRAAGGGDGPPLGPGQDDLAWSLVLDHLVFAAEAEVRWLDHVEARVARASLSRTTSVQGADVVRESETNAAHPAQHGARGERDS